MSRRSQNALVIRTADQISFAITLAGPMSRFLAWIIDVGAIAAALSMINGLFALIGFFSQDIAAGFYFAFNFILVLSYGIVLEWFWRGQTIGKRIIGLRVIDEQGLKLRLEQIILRNLLRVVDRLPLGYMVGGICMLLSRRNQRLGDIVAGTVVAYAPKASIPDVADILEHKYNSFRNHPHLEARLRKNTPPQAAALALEAISRRMDLDDTARITVFREVADYFREIVAFPDEDTLGITDEQYTRNVIDSIYNTRAK